MRKVVLMVVVSVFGIGVGAQDKLLKQDRRCGQETVKGSGVPRDCFREYEGPAVPQSPRVEETAVPAPRVTAFRAGPVLVNETIQPLGEGRSNVVLHLSDASGDAVEIDLQRLGDPTLDSAGTTYAYRTREQLQVSSAGKEYLRRLHALEAAVDRPGTGPTRVMTMEETQLLLHATVLGLATGDATAPTRFAARWTERAGRRPVQWQQDDCYAQFMRYTNLAYSTLYDCSNAVRDQRWYNQSWYSGSCGIEFTMRTASAYGNYFSCSHIGIGPTGPHIG